MRKYMETIKLIEATFEYADEVWQKKMIDIETRVSPDFQRIAFFHHLIFQKQ